MRRKADTAEEKLIMACIDDAEWHRQATYPASVGCTNCGKYVEVVIPQGMAVRGFMGVNSFVCGKCGCAVNKVEQ